MIKKYKKLANGGWNYPEGLTPEQVETLNNLDDTGKQNYLTGLGYDAQTDNDNLNIAAAAQPETENQNKTGEFLTGAGNAVSGIGPMFQDIAKNDMKKDERGRTTTGANSMASVGKGAGIGSQIGGAFGPIGTIIGMAVGAGVGGIKSASTNKKLKEEYFKEDTADAAALQESGAGPNKTFNWNDLAEGGKVKGPGTEKSDSVKGALPEGSFVVPAENAEKAEKIRKAVLGENPKKEAELSKGEPVAVSKNEHVFVPDEVRKIEQKGINLDNLAPDSKQKLRPSTEKFLAGIKSPEISALVNADSDNYLSTVIGEDWADDITENELNALLTSEEYSNYSTNRLSDGGGVKKAKEIGVGDAEAFDKYMSEVEGYGKEWYKNVDPNIIMKLSNSKEFFGFSENADYEKSSVYEKKANDPSRNENNKSIVEATNVPGTSEVKPPEQNTTGQKIIDAFGGTTGALSLAQLGFGLANQILEGKRPESKVDPDLTARLEDAKRFDNRGFTPEQKDVVLNAIEANRIAGNETARNLSGGNAALAISGQRAANSDAVRAVLEAEAKDNQIMMGNKSRTDSLAQAKASVFQQIQQEKLQAFQQNQGANAELIGAGIHNFVGNKQMRDIMGTEEKDKEAFDLQMKKYLESLTK